jgi:Flp pilus assembly protein TadD
LNEPGIKDHPDVAFARGILHYVQGKYAEALPHFRTATEKNPKFAGAHYQCGRCLAQLGKRDDEAIKAFEAALAADPSHFSTLRDMAVVQIRAGKKADALRRIADAELLSPDNPVLAELKGLAQAP